VVHEGLAGKSERTVKAELEYQMAIRGADGPSFDTIVAAGENAALPHHRASDKIITTEDAVIIDIGALVDGYHSDMTRTVRVGHLDREVSFMLSATMAAQHAALSQLKAGVTTDQVDSAARDAFREVGVEEFFTHGLGHGVGLAIHEEPFLSRRPGIALQEGEVVTVEPGLYRVGVGGVRIEDLVVITHDGYRSLSRTRKDVSCPQSARMI
jgi:Xaa-Pro aminopeptidase